MAKTIRPLFSWRQAICKSELDPSTKLVLFALSFYMNEMGASCFPTQKQLAEDTSLSIRQIKYSLKKAYRFGWIKRKLHGFKGQQWKNYEYFASVPEKKSGAGNAPAIKKVVQMTTEAGANDGKKVVQQVHTNSSVNSSLTLQEIEEAKQQRLAEHLKRLRAAKRP